MAKNESDKAGKRGSASALKKVQKRGSNVLFSKKYEKRDFANESPEAQTHFRGVAG